MLVSNERIEIHQNQRDYVGPITVPGSGMAIFITARVDGTEAVDMQVYDQKTCDEWLGHYVTQVQLGPATANPIHDEVLFRVAPNANPGAPPSNKTNIVRRRVRVPAGQYCVVLDNTIAAGRAMPPGYPGDDRAALVGIAIEVGDGT